LLVFTSEWNVAGTRDRSRVGDVRVGRFTVDDRLEKIAYEERIAREERMELPASGRRIKGNTGIALTGGASTSF
jgi:hypothetical protein